jgi:hypothetical protein
MAGTPTNYDVAQIHQGPGDLWIIGAGGAVADSATPQLMLDGLLPDATAYPNASHLGAADGATTIAAVPKMEEIRIDQADAPVAFFQTQLEMSLETELKQLDPAMIQNVAPFGVYSTATGASGYKQLTFGGAGQASPLCVAFIAQARAVPGKVVVAVLFNAIGFLGLNTQVGRAKASIYKAQFKGQADLTRAAGRQVGVVYTTNLQ